MSLLSSLHPLFLNRYLHLSPNYDDTEFDTRWVKWVDYLREKNYHNTIWLQQLGVRLYFYYCIPIFLFFKLKIHVIDFFINIYLFKLNYAYLCIFFLSFYECYYLILFRQVSPFIIFKGNIIHSSSSLLLITFQATDLEVQDISPIFSLSHFFHRFFFRFALFVEVKSSFFFSSLCPFCIFLLLVLLGAFLLCVRAILIIV